MYDISKILTKVSTGILQINRRAFKVDQREKNTRDEIVFFF